MTTPLLSPLAKFRFFGFMALLFATQRGKLRLDARYDDRSAEEALQLAGRDAADRSSVRRSRARSSAVSRSFRAR